MASSNFLLPTGGKSMYGSVLIKKQNKKEFAGNLINKYENISYSLLYIAQNWSMSKTNGH